MPFPTCEIENMRKMHSELTTLKLFMMAGSYQKVAKEYGVGDMTTNRLLRRLLNQERLKTESDG